jgi:hypothetical protein
MPFIRLYASYNPIADRGGGGEVKHSFLIDSKGRRATQHSEIPRAASQRVFRRNVECRTLISSSQLQSLLLLLQKHKETSPAFISQARNWCQTDTVTASSIRAES